MRQITRLLSRARVCGTKTFKSSVPGVSDVSWRRERKLLKEVVERQRSKFNRDFAQLKNMVEEKRIHMREIIYPSGVVFENVNSYDDFKPLEYVNRRRQFLRDAYLMNKETLNQALYFDKQDVKERLMSRRKLIQDAVKSRKDQIEITERKIMEKSREILQDIRDTKNIMKERVEQVVEKENIYTIPNLLCVSRIAFAPFLGYLIVIGNFHYALGFMAIAGFSDWLDGWIARNYKSQSSKIGSFLDPMADKVLIGTLFLSLTYVELIPLPLTALIVARDVALVVAGFVIRYQSLPPPRTLARYFNATHATAQLAPTWISKINTGVQLALVGSTLAAPVFGYVGHPALDVMCYITAASTILAAASYITNKDTYRYLGRK